ncbi:MAG: LysR family transcriptional regulator [Novosphingobium sp.]|uniref:LysR family transcriptional regulator n=1 Tax=Novosphingobium sp. TaxID=1874826 RepID=UPI00301B1900
MDLKQLRYFLVVASERNFTRASERLHIAQPPLSRAIQRLEEEVGAPLIDRHVRPMKLTPLGLLFQEQALQMLGRMDDMKAMVQAAVAAERRRFTIGFVASTMYARLPEYIREFRKRAPDLELTLIECTTLEQISALKDGRIDVGFGRIRFDDAAVKRTVLTHERLVVALPINHSLARESNPVSLHRIAQEPQIIYPRSPRPSYADQVLSLFRDYGHEPRVIHEARELQIAIGLVAAEEGVAVVPESITRSRSHDVTYRSIVEPATSPIIMSHRIDDGSADLQLMSEVIASNSAAQG